MPVPLYMQHPECPPSIRCPQHAFMAPSSSSSSGPMFLSISVSHCHSSLLLSPGVSFPFPYILPMHLVRRGVACRLLISSYISRGGGGKSNRSRYLLFLPTSAMSASAEQYTYLTREIRQVKLSYGKSIIGLGGFHVETCAKDMLISVC